MASLKGGNFVFVSGFLTLNADAYVIELGEMKSISMVVDSLASAMAGWMLKEARSPRRAY